MVGGGGENKVHYGKCGSGVRFKLRISQNRNKQIKTVRTILIDKAGVKMTYFSVEVINTKRQLRGNLVT